MVEVSGLSILDMITFCQTEIGDCGKAVVSRDLEFQTSDTFVAYESKRFSYRVFGAGHESLAPGYQAKALVQGDHLKVKDLQSILAERGAESILKLMPKHILSQPFGAYGFVTVTERPIGERKATLGATEIGKIGEFLSDLHDVQRFNTVNEMGFVDSGDPKFGHYAVSAALVYREMLYPDLDREAQSLIDDAVDFVKQIAGNKEIDMAESVIVHKDVFEGNLYWDGDELSTVDGWESAQTAPREWELAVIWNRFPDEWARFLESYKRDYDRNLLKICATVQALRFWKSFRNQLPFVAQQVDALKRCMTT